MSSVVDLTVSNGFCSGCGVCAGICPSHNLVMQWNIYGEYNPVKLQPCAKECGLCLKVCPFADGNDNEDVIGKKVFGADPNISHRPETGYYLSSGVGAVSSEDRRMASASGGLATWFFEELLRRDIVDAIICVEHSNDGKRLFRFYPAKNVEELRASTGSVYYPVEISEMVRYIHTNPGRYVVIGLPCVIKGLRLAQKKIPYLRERIILMVGLACSNLKSSRFAEYAAYHSGLQEKIGWCSFRGKSYSLPHNYFQFRSVGVNGTTTELNWGTGQLWKMYFERCFTLHSCDCCDDMFAECADITFMDAWLREYAAEPRGTSLWIARSSLAAEILSQGITDGSLEASPITIEKVILAQSSLRWKREMLKYRLLLMQEHGEICPKKRLSPEMGNLSFIERDKVRRSLEIQRESRLRAVDIDFEAFGNWFDTTWSNRPWFILLYLWASSLPADIYRRCEGYPSIQNAMRSMRNRFGE